jgi:hypothetical protein
MPYDADVIVVGSGATWAQARDAIAWLQPRVAISRMLIALT